MIIDKTFLALAATVLTLVAFVPYLWSIHRGHTRPHVFSWLVWGINTGIAALAMLAEQGGAGAWAVAFSSMITLYVAALAYQKRADISITRTDWGFFIAALTAMPVWLLTSDPLWAVVLITGVEVLGFGPTLRKCWHQPYSEPISFLVIMIVRNALVIAALERHVPTTLFFPLSMAAACGLLIAIMVWRRFETGLFSPSGCEGDES